MILGDYLDNPMGKGGIQLSKDAVSRFNRLYDELSNRKSGVNFSHTCYNNVGKLIVHVKVPSESIENIAYDVLIELSNTPTGNILGSKFKVFSNSPSFVYFYAHAYYKKNMVLVGVQKKLTEYALKNSAKVRNPFGVTIFEYSTYLAIKYLRKNRLINTKKMLVGAEEIKLSDLAEKMQDFDTLMNNYRILDKAQRREKREEAKAEKLMKQTLQREQQKSIDRGKRETDVKKSITSKQVKTTKTTKRTKTTKKTKKI